MPTFRARYTKMEKEAFGRQLRKLMTDKGLSGADLGRQATIHLPKGKVIGRDNISWYLNGRSMPIPTYLAAIAKVLDIDAQFLLPRDHSQRVGDKPEPAATPEHDVRMSLATNGDMHLMLNVHLPRDLGWKILKLVEDHKNDSSAQPKSR